MRPQGWALMGLSLPETGVRDSKVWSPTPLFVQIYFSPVSSPLFPSLPLLSVPLLFIPSFLPSPLSHARTQQKRAMSKSGREPYPEPCQLTPWPWPFNSRTVGKTVRCLCSQATALQSKPRLRVRTSAERHDVNTAFSLFSTPGHLQWELWCL